MQIGVDATCWQNERGYGRHARALLSALVRLDTANQYTFFLDSDENVETLPPQVKRRRVQTMAPTTRAASARGRRSALDLIAMSRALSDSKLDLVFFPTIYSYVPVVSRAKKIVMIHDTIAEKFPALTLPSPGARLFWNVKSAVGRWQADAIATVSDYARDCIVQQFRLLPERVFVVGEASDPVFRRLEHPQLSEQSRALGLSPERRTILYVGGFGPHKNLESLVEVLAGITAQERFADVQLVMVGEYARETFYSHFGRIKQRVQELGIADRVIFTGYMSDEELTVLLNLGTVLVLPSLMEGFGLPAVEAAACGCPVIATRESPLPGLLGEGGIYIRPDRSSELEDALTCVLESPARREHMRAAGLAAAQRLTWEAAARQMIELVGKVSPK